ncbi:MAG: MCP four helix bundle domain-containing protein [Burkholderiales bacterium]|jgi:methyl-accepting chemotaxis protein|nr:MCP four helix bundle domain-containing protein [Burkholderiales bacterium]
MRVSNLKIGVRLWMGFGLVIALMGAIVITSMNRMSLAEKRVDNILNDRYRKIALATEVKYNLALIHQHMRNALIESDAEGVKRETDAMNAIRATNRELLDAFDKIINVPRAREIFDAIIAARKQDLAAQKDLLATIASGDRAGAKQLLNGRVVDSEQAYVKLLSDMTELQKGKMDEESGMLLREFAAARTMMMALAAGAFALAMLAAWSATRSITRPMVEALGMARRVADGDLTAQIEVRSKDETGQLMGALKDMNANLAKIVGQVRGGTDMIATASSQIAVGNMDLSSRTEQQASSLQETASSMEELTGTVRQSADNARQASQLAVSASQAAVKGGQVVSQVVDTMGSINDSAKKIVEIIGVIDSIAFQTNILALNAAVEAARAGEQGRGFAVVASEVRGLAQRSAEAAKEIKLLIGDSVEKVAAGSKLVNEAGETMHEVVQSFRRVTDIIEEISHSSEEQTTGISQINQAISQIDGVTQQNASLVEEAAAASQSLNQQVAGLVRVVGVFRLSEAPALAA